MKNGKYHNKGSKKRLLRMIFANKEVLREDARNWYKNLSEREKEKIRKNQRDRFHMNIELNETLRQHQRNYYPSKKIKKWIFFFFFCVI